MATTKQTNQEMKSMEQNIPMQGGNQQSFQRSTPKMTGAQMITLSALRKEVGLPPLSQHNIRSMSLDSASVLIDDMMRLRELAQAYPQIFEQFRGVNRA